VARVVLPVVVNGVQQSVAGDLRGATRCTVYEVGFEGDLVLASWN
jgi:hypothetical protein